MKDWCVKLFLLGILFSPVTAHTQTRICIINECGYSDNPNVFLPLSLRESGSYENYNAGGTVAYGTYELMPLENYLFIKGGKTEQKTGIENQQASDLVVSRTCKRLSEKGYEPITPTLTELKALRKEFEQKGQTSDSGGKLLFFEFLCKHYNADNLVALKSCPFTMHLHSNKKRKKGTGKVVDANIKLSCINSWIIFNQNEKKITREFETKGSAELSWIEISRDQLKNGIFLKKSDLEDENKEFIAESWGFLPMIARTATDAAEYFEQNF